MANKNKIPYRHYVSEEERKVYVNVNGWIASLGAHHYVKKYKPGYECCVVTLERLEELSK